MGPSWARSIVPIDKALPGGSKALTETERWRWRGRWGGGGEKKKRGKAERDEERGVRMDKEETE